MTTDATPTLPPTSMPPTAVARDGTGYGPDRSGPPPLPLDLVELELALDLSDMAEHGFGQAVRMAANTVNGEFLFDLPASGLIDDAQRIAVVCLSRDEGGRFALVLLSANGDHAGTIAPDETTAGLVQFARAFVAVLEKL